MADTVGRAIYNLGLRPLTCWDCGFETRQSHGYLSLVRLVLSGRGLCVGLILRPQESYRVRCVKEWSWSLDNEEALAHKGCCAMVKKRQTWQLLRELRECLSILSNPKSSINIKRHLLQRHCYCNWWFLHLRPFEVCPRVSKNKCINVPQVLLFLKAWTNLFLEIITRMGTVHNQINNSCL